MKKAFVLVASLALVATACKKESKKENPKPAPTKPATAMGTQKGKKAVTPKKAPAKVAWQHKADAFFKTYYDEFSKLELAETTTFWNASLSGKKEDYAVNGKAKLALKRYHSDPKKYATIVELMKHKTELKPLTVRALEVALNDFKENQLPKEMLKTIVSMEKDIEQSFQSFRATYKKKKATDNELLKALKESNKSDERKVAWEALKAVGGIVGPKLVKLAKVRNEAAKKLGYKNFWYMKVSLQDHNPETLLALFKELDTLTLPPFKAMKTKLDKELAARFGVKPAQLRPWHYDNPFFQAPPASKAFNIDLFFKKMKKEQIVEMGLAFFKAMGLPMDDLAAKSDFYEKKGKDQNAFCIDMDRKGDVRTLLNIKPTAKWMDTMLHEGGHAVYDKFVDKTLPYNLRGSAHIFTTEGVAMLFGAAVQNPEWLTTFAKADKKIVEKAAGEIAAQRTKEQLIFTRWTLVMLNFEKALYDNPEQDLNKLWWDTVERYQLLTRPEKRNSPDWASKPHFTIAPVYYHNYMMGELFAAQMRAHIATLTGHKGPTSRIAFWNNPKVTKWFKEKVFFPGKRDQWEKMVQLATGTPLSAKAFAQEIK